MKTAKLIIGIISIILNFLILFQSCVVGLTNAIAESGESGGSAGLLLAFCMLVAGIVGICTRNSLGGSIFTGIVYAIGGLIGISNYGSYSDLMIWSVLCFIFAIVFILGSILSAKKKNNKPAPISVQSTDDTPES